LTSPSVTVTTIPDATADQLSKTINRKKSGSHKTLATDVKSHPKRDEDKNCKRSRNS